MIVYIVTGYNGLLNTYGPVGVATTIELAEKIKSEHEYMLDESIITETELVEAAK
jgi:hypothetical protein